MINDKVSIIIPVFNTEKYVETCVNSILCQTYKNIEILLINDGSKDKSKEICEKLVQKFSNVKLINHEVNQGVEATRNDGIISASGSWLLFLDSDDTLSSDAIFEMVKTSIKYDSDVVLTAFALVKHGRIFREVHGNINEGNYSNTEIASNIFTSIPLSVISCVGTKLYRRDLINKNKIFFNKDYKFNEDIAFALDAISFANSVTYIDKPFYLYLQRDNNSIQTSYRPNMFETLGLARLKVKDFLVKKGVLDNKFIEFQLMWLDVIYSSLVNEIRFNELNYKRLFSRIRNHPQTKEMLDNFENLNLRLDRNIIVYLLKKDKLELLYYFLKFLELIRKVKYLIEKNIINKSFT